MLTTEQLLDFIKQLEDKGFKVVSSNEWQKRTDKAIKYDVANALGLIDDKIKISLEDEE